MKRIAEVTRRFVKDEEGIAVSEYGLLVGIVAVGLVAVVTAFKNQIGTWFTNITSQLTATK
ncbi:MAG TPA: Flp family type IVb pilin [Gemmatimonadaceae bacterium]|nr:Flp family type IVb pilin [Gemmatimonadaceae bacterium]